jgi:hypothetical protein
MVWQQKRIMAASIASAPQDMLGGGRSQQGAGGKCVLELIQEGLVDAHAELLHTVLALGDHHGLIVICFCLKG